MQRYIIEKIDQYNYTLKDIKNNIKIVNIEFYDLPIVPKEQDYLYVIDEVIQNVNIPLNYRFIMPELFDIEINNTKDEELMILLDNNTKYYLKRIYG